MEPTPHRIVLVINSATHEIAKATFSRLKATAAQLGAVAALEFARSFERVTAETRRLAEVTARVTGDLIVVLDELPQPVDIGKPPSKDEWAKLAKEWMVIAEESEPRLNKHAISNAELRQRRANEWRASTRPKPDVLRGSFSRAVPRKRRHRRHP